MQTLIISGSVVLVYVLLAWYLSPRYNHSFVGWLIRLPILTCLAAAAATCAVVLIPAAIAILTAGFLAVIAIVGIVLLVA